MDDTQFVLFTVCVNIFPNETKASYGRRSDYDES